MYESEPYGSTLQLELAQINFLHGIRICLVIDVLAE